MSAKRWPTIVVGDTVEIANMDADMIEDYGHHQGSSGLVTYTGGYTDWGEQEGNVTVPSVTNDVSWYYRELEVIE